MQIKNIKEYKMNLRLHYRALRTNMKKECKDKLDSEIYNRVLSSTEYKNCKILIIYVSKKIEVDTLKIIERAFLDNKIVAVPKCIPEQKKMELYIIKSLNDLELGTFDVLEPTESKCKILNNYSEALCIVPGFSFDQEGYRLGYGQGYYDRFLSNFYSITAGLCYSHCIRRKLPHGYFDKSVDLLITDKYIMDTRRTIDER